MNLPDNVFLPDDKPVMVLTRTFAAPRTLVWEMFANPYHLAEWWGPKGYTNPVCELDFRVGGRWHNVMRSPKGVELPVDAIFVEIVKPERIVYRNAPATDAAFGANPPPSFLRTISFMEEAGVTTLTIRAEFAGMDERQRVIDRGFAQGTNESLDKLASLLADRLAAG